MKWQKNTAFSHKKAGGIQMLGNRRRPGFRTVHEKILFRTILAGKRKVDDLKHENDDDDGTTESEDISCLMFGSGV